MAPRRAAGAAGPGEKTAPVGGGLSGAVRECAAARMHTLGTIELARVTVRDRFTTYSVLHPWESPTKAFERRRGFCVQYNGALRLLLQGLGIDAWLVFATKVRMSDDPGWTLGHVWVQARVDGGLVEVCASPGASARGNVPFTAISPVRRLPVLGAALAAWASYAVAVAATGRARLRGHPRPRWVEHPRASTPVGVQPPARRTRDRPARG